MTVTAEVIENGSGTAGLLQEEFGVPPLGIWGPSGMRGCRAWGKKLIAGVPLGFEDGMALWQTRDIFSVGEMANFVRRKKHGNLTYYNINRHINYSNICALSCKFCEFHRKRGEAGAYEFSHEDVFRMAGEAAASGATEIHIVGGLHPWLPFDWYLGMLQRVAERTVSQAASEERLPRSRSIILQRSASSPRARCSRRSRRRGWARCPAGGRKSLMTECTMKSFAESCGRMDGWKCIVPPTSWAFAPMPQSCMGMSKRARSVCGISWRCESCKKNRRPEPGFRPFIPLSFIPEGSELGHLPGNTGLEDLKMLAISRLMLDNFEHVKAFWIMQSMKLSQVSLSFGVDDLDGTVVWYDIHASARGHAGINTRSRPLRESSG